MKSFILLFFGINIILAQFSNECVNTLIIQIYFRQQKELEGRELLPVSRFLFSNYAEAAQAGTRNEDCGQVYTGCPRQLSYYLSAKEDPMENEIENGK